MVRINENSFQNIKHITERMIEIGYHYYHGTDACGLHWFLNYINDAKTQFLRKRSCIGEIQTFFKKRRNIHQLTMYTIIRVGQKTTSKGFKSNIQNPPKKLI